MDNAKKKICFVVAVDITLKFLLISELKFFKQKGYDVFVVCSPGPWLQNLRKEGILYQEITIQRKSFTPLSDLASLFRLFFYFKKEKFDAVLTFTPKPGLLGQLAAKMAGIPVIINTIFGFYFHENTSPLKRAFLIFIEKVAAACSSFIFFRNKEDFETAKKEHIGEDAIKEYIGDGIDIAKYDAKRFSEEFVGGKKKSLGISAGAAVIGIVARLVKEKGYLELFGAFKKVLEKFPNAVLLVIGPVDLQKKDRINQDDFKQKNIMFLGERTDVDELYAAMDIFTLPSYREGFPHSVMEASAMSLPVVTTNVRGCRNAVEDGVTGKLIPAGDAGALANMLIYFLENPEIALEMGRNGRKKAEREFNEDIIFEKIEKTYELLLGAKK